MTQYSSNYDGTTPFSDTNASINLAVATIATYTVPGTSQQKYRAKFTWGNGANVYVGLNATPVASTSGAVTNMANVEFNPSAKYVKGGDVLSFLSSAAVTDSGLSLLLLNA